MEKEIVYLEFNHWSTDYYPDCEPFHSWMYDLTLQFRKEDWLLENKLVVVETLVDMSCNYCITAPKEWILGVCPDFFEKYSKFVREPEEDEDTPYGRFGCPFLEYTEENLGYWFAGWDEEWNPRRLEKGFYDDDEDEEDEE